jgi:hypothetical protein
MIYDFAHFISESSAKATKNLHLEHLEDEILNNGYKGFEKAVQTLKGVILSLKGNEPSSHDLTLKWDGCVHSDSLVLTENGMQKISNVSVGDKVLGFDMVEKKSSYTMVSNTKTNNNGKRWIEVIFQNDKSIRVTEDHEIYTKNRGWVEAKNLTTEDDVEDIELSI